MPDQRNLWMRESAVMARLLSAAERYAMSPHPLLILGERGSGKTLLARHIHELSGRPGAFVRESMAGIPEHLEHAHLVGHVRGAFTGALSDRIGLIEAAHEGTLVLDELGVASRRVQEILLQLFDESAVRRIGETRSRPVSVRVIGATNADLDDMVANGTFRRDLRDRFGFLVLRVPPLRERRDDILRFAACFLRIEARRVGRTGDVSLGRETEELFRIAPWAGNIRELQDVCIFGALEVEHESVIEPHHLPPEFLATLGAVARKGRPPVDRLRAAAVLAQHGGNKADTARDLGISRQHLYRLLA